MKCQILFSGKTEKTISICCLLKSLPGVLSVKGKRDFEHLSNAPSDQFVLSHV